MTPQSRASCVRSTSVVASDGSLRRASMRASNVGAGASSQIP
jgi:hypothetical protein